MTEKGVLFKKLLGARELIKTSVKLDQPIMHYIAYDYNTNEFELTVFAQAKTASVPAWVFKLMLPHKYLERVLLLFKKIILKYEKLYLKEVLQ